MLHSTNSCQNILKYDEEEAAGVVWAKEREKNNYEKEECSWILSSEREREREEDQNILLTRRKNGIKKFMIHSYFFAHATPPASS